VATIQQGQADDPTGSELTQEKLDDIGWEIPEGNVGAPTITSAATVSVAENQTAVIDVQSTDPEGLTEGAGLTYSLSGGADQSLFSIDTNTGVVTFQSPPNFEAPGDVNEAPTITSVAAIDVAENETAVIDVQSTDPEGLTEGAGLTYSLSGGADQALFSIDTNTGVLTFASPMDFESPLDSGFDNFYEVQVRVFDGANGRTQDIVVTVTDIDAAPTIDPIADQAMSHNLNSLILPLVVTGDAPILTVEAFQLDVLAQKAYQLDQQYNFTQIAAGDSFNANGAGERYLLSNSGYFYILGNGEVYQWGGSIAASTLVETLDATYAADLSQLVDVPLAGAVPVAGVNVSITGSTLTIDPPAGYTGTFTVKVTASDGVSLVEQSFAVTVAP